MKYIMSKDFKINGMSYEQTIQQLEKFMQSEYFCQGPMQVSNMDEWGTLKSARDFMEWMFESLEGKELK